MTTAREQAREAVEACYTPARRAEDVNWQKRADRHADAASDVWEPLTAAYQLQEAGIDLDRLTRVLESKDNWGHLVHAYEVLAVLGAVKNEMEALQ